MAQVGNNQNSVLNGEWAKHVRWWYKRHAAGRRREEGKQIIKETLKEVSSFKNHMAFLN